MSEIEFYDIDWRIIFRKYPELARKLDDLRCDSVDYETFEELEERVALLETVLFGKNEQKGGEKNEFYKEK